ncbi:SUF system Fe-S cluster assembly protein [Azospirillum sp. TSO22-1]|uniref:SUF system Fe-S cluster assembly protein n=1 Tax=Azospirillum sp. TSO22-1 TaxID=716789 RepID=UPI000D65CAA6|nr:SUF system Fe-S cluster assembly protein [Azospirillum sp. TSO22-1]
MPEDATATDIHDTPAVSIATGKEGVMERIVEAIKTCYDPEIPVDIWELGLIYRVDVNDAGEVEVDMTLTSPMCPVAGELPLQVQEAVQNAEGVTTCKIDLVWEPPWRPDMMSDVAKIQLDMF